jgi:hypothetical protein
MIRALFFLEDRAQERLIVSLVQRVFKEESLDVDCDVRSASHGARVFTELGRFARDLRKERNARERIDVIIVAKDANCKGYAWNAELLRSRISKSGLLGRTVLCIPDPHIEKWYLLDLGALRTAVGAPVNVQQPAYKCKRDWYKSQLSTALAPLGSLLGGAEYAEDIVSALDFQTACSFDQSFARFLTDLRSAARKLKLYGRID